MRALTKNLIDSLVYYWIYYISIIDTFFYRFRNNIIYDITIKNIVNLLLLLEREIPYIYPFKTISIRKEIWGPAFIFNQNWVIADNHVVSDLMSKQDIRRSGRIGSIDFQTPLLLTLPFKSQQCKDIRENIQSHLDEHTLNNKDTFDSIIDEINNLDQLFNVKNQMIMVIRVIYLFLYNIVLSSSDANLLSYLLFNLNDLLFLNSSTLIRYIRLMPFPFGISVIPPFSWFKNWILSSYDLDINTYIQEFDNPRMLFYAIHNFIIFCKENRDNKLNQTYDEVYRITFEECAIVHHIGVQLDEDLDLGDGVIVPKNTNVQLNKTFRQSEDDLYEFSFLFRQCMGKFMFSMISQKIYNLSKKVEN